jgi:hypothetical protein
VLKRPYLVCFAVGVCAVIGVGAYVSSSEAEAPRPDRASLDELASSVHSLRMTIGTPKRVRLICERVERQITRRVVCPRLVPAAPISRIPDSSGTVESRSVRDIYAITFNTGGTDPRSSASLHWVVGRGTKNGFARAVLDDRENEVSGTPRRIGTRAIDGLNVQLFRFPPHPAGGQYGDHTLAMIVRGRSVVFASVHGYSHLDASAAMAVALVRYP